MGRLEIVFKIGKRLHELPRSLARDGTVFISRAKATDKPGEKTFDRAHYLEREMHHGMPCSIRHATNFLSNECVQVDMRDDKLSALDHRIKFRALNSEKTSFVARLILYERQEPREGNERDEYQDEVRHGG